MRLIQMIGLTALILGEAFANSATDQATAPESNPVAQAEMKPALPAKRETQAKKKWSKQELQKIYLDYFAKEGYRGEVDKDGDILFKAGGKNYYIDVTPDDPQFFRIVFPAFWSIDSPEERIRALGAISSLSQQKKLLKAFIQRDDVWASCETFLATPEEFSAHFSRMMDILSSVGPEFRALMQQKKNNE